MSVRTVYTYLDMGLFTSRNIDLKRKVKFKPRKVHKTQISDRKVFTDRTYSDFSELHLDSFVEMDTVHSSNDSAKTLLTFFFTKEKLFLAFLMNRNTEGAVRLVFDRLEKRLGTYEFLSLFEHILTDRGSEFGDPDSLETGITGFQRFIIAEILCFITISGFKNQNFKYVMEFTAALEFRISSQRSFPLILNSITI